MPPMPDAFSILSARCPGRVDQQVPIAPFTSYQLGGPARLYLEPESEADLIALGEALAAEPMPMLIVGRGSNMLVSDRGFDGIAIRLGAGFRWARIEQETIVAGAATPVPTLATTAARATLSGFEFAVAIPGSFGGAIAMNAGAHGRSISDVLTAATVFDLVAGQSRSLSASEMGFAYRTSRLPAGSIVTGGVLQLAAGTPDQIEAGMNEAKTWRKETQPIGLPNAGSVFKNPPGDSAGRLVETIVGKGTGTGRARVSEVHANFIVTEPGATSGDVYSLIRRIQREVRQNADVDLETEVKLVGRFDEPAS